MHVFHVFGHSVCKDHNSTEISYYVMPFIDNKTEPSSIKLTQIKLIKKNSQGFPQEELQMHITLMILSQGSPTITLLRLFLPPIQSIRSNFPPGILATHNEYQSEETTGGVYKRQGRIQHAILEHSYKGFLVQVRKLQQTIPFKDESNDSASFSAP